MRLQRHGHGSPRAQFGGSLQLLQQKVLSEDSPVVGRSIGMFSFDLLMNTPFLTNIELQANLSVIPLHYLSRSLCRSHASNTSIPRTSFTAISNLITS